jgi:hypothetical protein
MCRFLDNVNECEIKYSTYATPHQRLAIEKLRRISSPNGDEMNLILNLTSGIKKFNCIKAAGILICRR